MDPEEWFFRGIFAQKRKKFRLKQFFHIFISINKILMLSRLPETQRILLHRPLRIRKVGRVWCGGARETHGATCHNGVTPSKTKEFLKFPCFLDLNGSGSKMLISLYLLRLTKYRYTNSFCVFWLILNMNFIDAAGLCKKKNKIWL